MNRFIKMALFTLVALPLVASNKQNIRIEYPKPNLTCVFINRKCDDHEKGSSVKENSRNQLPKVFINEEDIYQSGYSKNNSNAFTTLNEIINAEKNVLTFIKCETIKSVPEKIDFKKYLTFLKESRQTLISGYLTIQEDIVAHKNKMLKNDIDLFVISFMSKTQSIHKNAVIIDKNIEEQMNESRAINNKDKFNSTLLITVLNTKIHSLINNEKLEDEMNTVIETNTVLSERESLKKNMSDFLENLVEKKSATGNEGKKYFESYKEFKKLDNVPFPSNLLFSKIDLLINQKADPIN